MTAGIAATPGSASPRSPGPVAHLSLVSLSQQLFDERPGQRIPTLNEWPLPAGQASAPTSCLPPVARSSARISRVAPSGTPASTALHRSPELSSSVHSRRSPEKLLRCKLVPAWPRDLGEAAAVQARWKAFPIPNLTPDLCNACQRPVPDGNLLVAQIEGAGGLRCRPFPDHIDPPGLECWLSCRRRQSSKWAVAPGLGRPEQTLFRLPAASNERDCAGGRITARHGPPSAGSPRTTTFCMQLTHMASVAATHCTTRPSLWPQRHARGLIAGVALFQGWLDDARF